MGNNIEPKVGDQYWFDYSKKLVDQSQEKSEQAAAKLQNLVIWLWGIYTTFATVGFALSGKNFNFWTTFIIASASATLILVYWGTVWVQMPVLISFDPRSPTDIRNVHHITIHKKRIRLIVTLVISFASNQFGSDS